jgi:hypothetical protein
MWIPASEIITLAGTAIEARIDGGAMEKRICFPHPTVGRFSGMCYKGFDIWIVH